MELKAIVGNRNIGNQDTPGFFFGGGGAAGVVTREQNNLFLRRNKKISVSLDGLTKRGISEY